MIQNMLGVVWIRNYNNNNYNYPIGALDFDTYALWKCFRLNRHEVERDSHIIDEIFIIENFNDKLQI